MSGRVLLSLLLCSAISVCGAEEKQATPSAAAPATAGPTMMDKWSELVRQAYERAGAIKRHGKPRVVPRGAKPEIILKDSTIEIDGQIVGIGR